MIPNMPNVVFLFGEEPASTIRTTHSKKTKMFAAPEGKLHAPSTYM
jgi:hypothetical protein